MTVSIPTRAQRFDMLAQLYDDERFTNGHSKPMVRNFIEAVHWAQWKANNSTWDTLLPILGWDDGPGRWRELLWEDLPRWEPESYVLRRGCEQLLTRGPRQGQRCGQHPHNMFTVVDPTTGQPRASLWCRQHHDQGKAFLRTATQPVDPPHPNRGGLLPCYLSADGQDWAQAYSQNAPPTWEPPSVGVCADDWPWSQPTTQRPKLTLIFGDG